MMTMYIVRNRLMMNGINRSVSHRCASRKCDGKYYDGAGERKYLQACNSRSGRPHLGALSLSMVVKTHYYLICCEKH